jgi:hypothetical protein
MHGAFWRAAITSQQERSVLKETPAASHVSAARTDTRLRYIDVGDCRWLVREVPYPSSDRRVGTSLIFSCDARVARIRSFPVDWFTVSDVVLGALLVNQY